MTSEPGLLRLTTRARRLGVASAIGVGVVAGALLMGPTGQHVAMPGPLRSFHANLQNDCNACHVASLDAIQGPLHGLEPGEPGTLGLAQSRRCLSCHAGLSERPLAPHGWSATQAEVHGVPAPRPGTGADTGVVCSTCHHEHQGRDVPLARLDNTSCQSCHTRFIDDFESEHPAFSTYPFDRRPALRFDHEAHIERHFAASDASGVPTSCTACHEPEVSGERMLLVDYATGCAACHDAQVRGDARADSPGLAVWNLPALDVLGMRDAGAPLGAWPADVAYTEEPLAPIGKLMLSADAASARRVALLDPEVLLDFLDAQDEEVNAAAAHARDVKRLLADIAERGQPALVERLESMLGRQLTASEAGAVAGWIPQALLRESLDAWLPELTRELELPADDPSLRDDTDPPAGDVTQDAAREAWAAGGGWYRHDEDFSLRYRPRGHADEFLRVWIDLACELASLELPQDARASAIEQATGALLDPAAPGACLSCHAVERSRGGRLGVPWGARHERGSLTPFVHATHFPGLGEQGCLRCHQLDSRGGAFLEAFDDLDPYAGSSGFAPMSTADCASCHSPTGASVSCLTCHDYHAGSAPRRPSAAPLRWEASDDSIRGSSEHEATR